MLLRSSLIDCRTNILGPSLEEEVLEHLLGIEGFSSNCLGPRLLRLVGYRQEILFESKIVCTDCCNIGIGRVSLLEVVEDHAV